MRTITEFAAITLKNAAKTKAELLASGKTAEELPAAMGEALKLEGDKLNFLMNAIEAAGEKYDNMKRVVVSSLNEGEKAPSGAKQMGEQYYAVEFYPSMRSAPQDAGRDERGGRGGRGGRGDKRGGGKPGERGGRGPGGGGGPGGDRGARGPRGPRQDGQQPQGANASGKPPVVVKPRTEAKPEQKS